VHADENQVLGRIAQRARPEELVTQQDTFMRLHEYYDRWLGADTVYYSDDLGEEFTVLHFDNSANGAMRRQFDHLVNTPAFNAHIYE
jgi:deoxyadenosine/deoxycytidine kinase